MWGKNSYGQLGDGSTIHRSSPVQTTLDDRDWMQVSCGAFSHAAGVRTDGSLYIWGRNNFGQLGTDNTTDISEPAQTIASGYNWAQVRCGYTFTLALKEEEEKTLWSWGNNSHGQLGDNTTSHRSSPVQLEGEDWKLFSAGFEHAAAIKTDGTLWVWGRNDSGELGLNNIVAIISSPVQTIAGGDTWVEVSCGDAFTLGRKNDGTVWGWGSNAYGQYGNGTTSSVSSPVQVLLPYWMMLTAGKEFSAGIVRQKYIPVPPPAPTPAPSPSPGDDQCPYVVALPYPGLSIIFGDIILTGNGTGSIGVTNTDLTVKCYDPNFEYVSENNPALAIGSDGSFSYVLSFSQPQNFIKLLICGIGITGQSSTIEEFSVLVDNQPSGFELILNQTCGMQIAGNQIVDDGVSPVGGKGKGITFTISAESDFSAITISGPGQDKGSTIYACSSSPSTPSPDGTPTPTPTPSPDPDVGPPYPVIIGTKAYFAGGYDGAAYSTRIDKFDYATDTCTTATSVLSSARGSLTGVSNFYSYGFFSGGNTGTAVATSDKIVYADDSCSAAVSANLSAVRMSLAGFDGNGYQGYFGGGYSTVEVATIDKIVYPTNTTTSASPVVLQAARRFLTCLSNNGYRGYFTGGYDSSDFLQTTEIFTLTTETLAYVSTADLVDPSSSLAGVSGNGQKGYYVGGLADSVFLGWMNVVDFSTNITTRVNTASLDVAVAGLAGVSQGSSAGYVAGGNNETVFSDTISKIFYEFNSLFALQTAVLSQKRTDLAAVSQTLIPFYLPTPTGDGTYGYIAGGYTGSLVAVGTIDKLEYSTDTTTSSTSFNLVLPRYKLAGLSENINKGYFTGGVESSQTYSTERLTYSPEAISQVSSLDLQQPKDSLAGISEGITKGYFIGGFTDAETNVITKIIFSPETRQTLTTATLTEPRTAIATIDGQGLKGYISGGSVEAGFSSLMTEVMYYTIDTPYQVSTAVLSDARRYLAGVGNRENKGYFAGGIGTSYDLIDRVAFSTDVTSAVTSDVLSVGRFGLAGVSQGATKGYFAGGRSGSTNLDTIDKIEFSTDTVYALTSSPLSQARNTLAAASQIKVPNPTYGGSGTIYIFGTSKFQIKYQDVGSGEIIIGGDSPSYPSARQYIGSGTIVVSGTVGSGVLKYIEWALPITYAIQNVLEVALPITYYVAQEIYYGYRVEGECITLENCDGPFNDPSLACSSRTIVNVVARTPREVCQQLKKQNWIWPIKKFQKYTKPVYKNDEDFLVAAGLYNQSCPTFEDTDFCYDQECQDFCVDYLVQETFTLDSFGIATGSEYEGSGEAIIYGQVVSRRRASSFKYPVVWPGTQSAYGYLTGGLNYGSSTIGLDTVVYVNFNTDVFALDVSESLSSAVYGASGCSGTTSKGYVFGGSTDGFTGAVADANKITYSSGIVSSVASADLSLARFLLATVSNGVTKGYSCGGSTSQNSFSSIADAVQYSGDTSNAVTTADLTQSRRSLVGLDGNNIRGYFCGGVTNAAFSVVVRTTDRIFYPTETTTAKTSASLQTGRQLSAGSTGNFYNGYIAGGSPNTKTTERLSYAFETSTQVNSAELDVATYGMTGISQGISHGYFVGGYAPTMVRRTHKILFSTESTSVSNNMPTSGGLSYTAGTAPYRPYNMNVNNSGIVIDGTAPFETTNAGGRSGYIGSGFIIIDGDALLAGYKGEIIEYMTVDMEEFYYVPVLDSSSGIDLLPTSTSSILYKCACKNIPLKFSLVTNLDKSSEFKNFLNRSNITFDPIINVYYDQLNGLYLNAIHLIGRSSDGSAAEKWTIVVNMNCENDLDNFDTDFIWTLTLNIKRYVAGSNDLDTSVQVWLPAAVICPNSNGNALSFDLQVNVDTASGLLNNIYSVVNIFINDRIELFGSQGWKSDPILNLSVVPVV